MASTMSLIVIRNDLHTSLVWPSDSVALANVLAGDTTWFRKVGGACKGRARLGSAPRSRDRRRNRQKPDTASLTTAGHSTTCWAWSRAAARSNSGVDGGWHAV